LMLSYWMFSQIWRWVFFFHFFNEWLCPELIHPVLFEKRNCPSFSSLSTRKETKGVLKQIQSFVVKGLVLWRSHVHIRLTLHCPINVCF
jgi:hypothetical protein